MDNQLINAIADQIATRVMTQFDQTPQAENIQPGHLLSKMETAELLGVSRPTLDAWIKNNGLPVIKLGKVSRFDRDDVLTWAKSYTIQTA